jgi:hypothetical protein
MEHGLVAQNYRKCIENIKEFRHVNFIIITFLISYFCEIIRFNGNNDERLFVDNWIER